MVTMRKNTGGDPRWKKVFYKANKTCFILYTYWVSGFSRKCYAWLKMPHSGWRTNYLDVIYKSENYQEKVRNCVNYQQRLTDVGNHLDYPDFVLFLFTAAWNNSDKEKNHALAFFKHNILSLFLLARTLPCIVFSSIYVLSIRTFIV